MTIRPNAKTIALVTVVFGLSGFFLWKLAGLYLTLKAVLGG